MVDKLVRQPKSSGRVETRVAIRFNLVKFINFEKLNGNWLNLQSFAYNYFKVFNWLISYGIYSKLEAFIFKIFNLGSFVMVDGIFFIISLSNCKF